MEPTAAANVKGYREKLAEWEAKAGLSDSQKAKIASLASISVSRPLPSTVTPAAVAAAAGSDDEGGPSVRTRDEFYKWFANLESAAGTARVAEGQRQVGLIRGNCGAFATLLTEVDSILARLSEMRTYYQTVQTKTQEVHEQCDQLLRDKTELEAFADAIRSKLDYFDELERIGLVFGSADQRMVTDPDFMALLERLDECVAYVSVNPQFREAAVFAEQFMALQAQGLAIVVEHFKATLREITAKVLPDVQRAVADPVDDDGEGGGAPDPSSPPAAALTQLSEASILYARYRADAPQLNVLMGEIERRRPTNEICVDLLVDCQEAYIQIRQTVLGDIISTNLQKLAEGYATAVIQAEANPDVEHDADLSELVRSGWGYIIRICELEHKLWTAIFPAGCPTEGLRSLVESHCLQLYDILRPLHIRDTSLDAIASCIQVLRREMLEEEMARRGAAAGFCRAALERSVGDLQERLIFLTQTYIRDQIETFEPTDADLDYPHVLEGLADASPRKSSGPRGDNFQQGLYVPLQRCLTCLSKLYRCVDSSVFGELAQEAVSVTTMVLLDASRSIANLADTMHGNLFLVKHLLTLREQVRSNKMHILCTLQLALEWGMLDGPCLICVADPTVQRDLRDHRDVT